MFTPESGIDREIAPHISNDGCRPDRQLVRCSDHIFTVQERTQGNVEGKQRKISARTADGSGTTVQKIITRRAPQRRKLTDLVSGDSFNKDT